MSPSDSRLGPRRFRRLIRRSRWPPHPRRRVSSTGQPIFQNMPSLLPRESMGATSVIPAPFHRPSPFDHRVGFSTLFTRLLIGSLALRPALLLCGNSRPRVATTPLPHATKVYGQFLGRDFNPLDILLLLRTGKSVVASFFSMRPRLLLKDFSTSRFARGQNLHSHIPPGLIRHSWIFRMVHFSQRVFGSKVIEREDGCPIDDVGHDGRKGLGPGLTFTPHST